MSEILDCEVTMQIPHYDKEHDVTIYPSKTFDSKYHGIVHGEIEGRLVSFALIEMEDGKLEKVDPEQVRIKR